MQNDDATAVREVKATASDLVLAALEPIDMVDAFAVALDPRVADINVEAFARCMLEEVPAWQQRLLNVRDLLVSISGIATTSELGRRAQAGGRYISFFRVMSNRSHHLLLGHDDRHLDFRLVFAVRPSVRGHAELYVTTVVRCHNSLGRIYLALIKPFHRLIVQSNLARVTRARLNSKV